MKGGNFFDEAKEQSIVKSVIVSKYFWAWAKVIMPSARRSGNKIAYIDLFAGPGRYNDGTKSTPLLILEKAIEDSNMRQMLVTIFNDADSDNSKSLERAIHDLRGIDTLKYQPQITTKEVGDEMIGIFEQTRLIPTFFFVDPWGYKGLSLRLVNSVLKNWGCDCIFFFNYNRINMGLPNEAVDLHLNALFGNQRAERLRRKLNDLDQQERELAIVEEIAQALKEMGGAYVLPFRFRNDKGNRTSHHLIFVTKNFRGYEIMKEIMARESSTTVQGVSSFEYSPATVRQPLLFELSQPLDALTEMLLDEFAGQQLSMQQIYEKHNVGRPYLESNYKAALRKLEAEGKIATNPPANMRRPYQGEASFGSKVIVTFPKKAR